MSEDFLNRRFQVFSAVATLLSFTKAANALCMTQPAATFQVKQLEEQFNCKLFIRAHNKVVLTNEGESMMMYLSDFKNTFLEKNKQQSSIKELEKCFGIPLFSEDGKLTSEAIEFANSIYTIRTLSSTD